MKKILLVDDDKNYLETLRIVLSKKYHVDSTTQGTDALKMCSDKEYDLVLTDLYMNEMNGDTFVSIAKSLFPRLNIVVLSGKASDEDQIRILESSTLDFIDKATAPEVILKRVDILIEMTSKLGNLKTILESKKEELELNTNTRNVVVRGREFKLTNKEYGLLHAFLTNKNKVLSREEIYAKVWNDKEKNNPNYRIIDLNVVKLRKRLGIKSIHSERGKGYIWEEI